MVVAHMWWVLNPSIGTDTQNCFQFWCISSQNPPNYLISFISRPSRKSSITFNTLLQRKGSLAWFERTAFIRQFPSTAKDWKLRIEGMIWPLTISLFTSAFLLKKVFLITAIRGSNLNLVREGEDRSAWWKQITGIWPFGNLSFAS